MHSQSTYQDYHTDIFINIPDSSQQIQRNTNEDEIRSFHSSLPGYAPTTLHRLTSLAQDLGLLACLVKDESSRLGLPAFKILGASWGVYRALCEQLKLPADPSITSIQTLRAAISGQRDSGNRICLYAATDGNHGRAVARMARLLILSDTAVDKVVRGDQLSDDEAGAVIYVPKDMYETTRKLIRSEGAKVIEVDGDYDVAVKTCWDNSRSSSHGISVMVQDNAFEYSQAGEIKMYKEIPGWIVEGYNTLLDEVDQESVIPTHVITPIGVGSLGHAVVNWAKSSNPPVKVITVEPERAGCLYATLKAGKPRTVKAEETIMSGMCCGTVSPISYQALKAGVDVSVLLSEYEAHQAVLDLKQHEIESGPCGAATLAGLKKIMKDVKVKDHLELNKSSVVLMLSTEGSREYPVPSI